MFVSLLLGSSNFSNLCAQEKGKGSEWQSLFNGKDLSNWDLVLGQRGPTRVNEDPDKVFQIHDGMVHTYKDTKEGWNTIELIVRGSESAVHIVNGTVVNRVSDLRQLDKDGKILFQAEVAEAFYRNIEIKELPVEDKGKAVEK